VGIGPAGTRCAEATVRSVKGVGSANADSVSETLDGPRDPIRSRGDGLFQRLAILRLGLAGQVLTFSAMLVPIVLHQAEQIFVLVFAGAVSVLLSHASVLGYPFLYPVVRGPRIARTATVWSLAALLTVSACVLPLSLLEPALELPRGTFAAAAALTLGSGLYTVAVTRLIHAADGTGLGMARLYYGSAILVTATGASLLPLGPLALSLGSALASAVAAAAVAARCKHRWPPVPRLSADSRRRLRRAYLLRTVRPTLAGLANGWTVFLPGLALLGLGVAAAPWAVVCRICGGFGTVLMQVLGPPIEARLGRAIRTRDRVAFTAARRTALLVGFSTAALAVGTALGLAVYATDPSVVDQWLLPLSVATTLFWGSLLAGSVVNRLPSFLGRHNARLYWDAGRALLVTVAFLTTDGVVRLIVTGAVLTVSGALLVPMSRWR
jgi:hypothetical protein